MRIAVAGGTGLVGRHVVDAVTASGHDVVVLARSTGVDLTDGRSLALDGVSAVIDVTNVVTLRRDTSTSFFGTVTRALLEAGRRCGVEHHVALSIVGADRIDYPYYAGKRLQEELVLAGPVPCTVLRATQFHEFTEQLLARRRPVVVVPRMRSQPVAAHEVAAALVDRALSGPVGVAPELAGPEVREMGDLVRAVLGRQASRRRVVEVRLPGAAGRAMASGGLLPTSPGPRGVTTFDQWLASRGGHGGQD